MIASDLKSYKSPRVNGLPSAGTCIECVARVGSMKHNNCISSSKDAGQVEIMLVIGSKFETCKKEIFSSFYNVFESDKRCTMDSNSLRKRNVLFFILKTQ